MDGAVAPVVYPVSVEPSDQDSQHTPLHERALRRRGGPRTGQGPPAPTCRVRDRAGNRRQRTISPSGFHGTAARGLHQAALLGGRQEAVVEPVGHFGPPAQRGPALRSGPLQYASRTRHVERQPRGPWGTTSPHASVLMSVRLIEMRFRGFARADDALRRHQPARPVRRRPIEPALSGSPPPVCLA